jgi:DegV family protein with EDD domain
MSVKIVTDSIADLPEAIVKELHITVVPMTVKFGEQVYRDGVDMTAEQFYEKLKTSRIFPNTSVPYPSAFTEVYDRLAVDGSDILTIAASSKLTASNSIANQAISLMKNKSRVEVIDSHLATMAEGFIVMAAARIAQAGAAFEEVKKTAYDTINQVELRATFDTLEYLRRGGRLGRAKAIAGSVLRVNPIVTLKDGAVAPVERVRSRAKAIDHLFEFAKSYTKIEEIAVEDTACPDEADALVDRLGALYPKDRIYRSKMTPTVGAHTGPGLLLIAIRGDLHSRV